MIDPKQEYDDWIELLKHTGNEDLLKDPYSIWLEAWTIALMTSKKAPTEVGVT